MTQRIRRIIMFIFIGTFIIVAPILIFYSSGYRIDLKRGKIIKTGTLYLEAKDINQANLYINNEKQETVFNEKTFVYNLIPGEYDVRLEKNDYYPWEKKVTINSSLTTFAKDIILFKKNIPLQLIDGDITDFVISPDKNKIIYLIQTETLSELQLLNLETKKTDLIYRPSDQNNIKSIDWAASSKKILIQTNNDFLIFDIQNLKQVLSINQILDFKPVKIKWDINSDNLLYTADQNAIYQIDLLFKKANLFYTNLQGTLNPEFFIEGNDIYYIQKTNNQDTLFKYNSSFQTDKKVRDLRLSQNYQFISSTNNFIGIIDQDNEKLYLIKKILTELNIESNQDDVMEFAAKFASWDDKQEQLLIYDDFEINQYNTKTAEKYFINRYGQEINKAIWYPNLSYIVIQFNGSLKIIDLNTTNGTRNVTEIVNFDQLYNFSLSDKGKAVYFSGQIGKQQGLYELNLR